MMTNTQVKHNLALLERWRAYMRYYAEHGASPALLTCNRLWNRRSTATASYHLRNMVQAGLLKRVSTGKRKGYYYPDAKIVETGGKLYAYSEERG